MNTDEYNKAFKEHVKKLTTPIFKKVLQETSSDHMSGRLVGRNKGQVVLYRPHNYRLFFDFNSCSFLPPKNEGLIFVCEPGRGVGSFSTSAEFKEFRSQNSKFFKNMHSEPKGGGRFFIYSLQHYK